MSDVIWDYLLLRRSKILVKAGLAIFSQIERNMSSCNDFCKFAAVLKRE
ncbi:MAG: hypothetical protein P4M11_11840 [Candidatus Pacebacteria bacterium]|nr:hypothetical protein [Candidatus Paceibacterota bacterium]